MKSLLNLSILALSLSSIGCSIGPVYKKPEVDLPQSFQINSEQIIVASNIDMIFWWENFKDPLLSELVSVSLRENNDLRKMVTRIDADTAFLKETQRDIYPAVTMSGAVGHQHLSQNQAFGYKQSADVYRAGINASWEIDVYGRVRKAVDAKQKDVLALQSDMAALQIGVVGRLAETYFHLRSMQDKLQMTKQSVDIQEKLLDLINKRYEAGRGTQLDVARAQTLLARFRARIPELETQIAIDEHRIAVLSGMNPDKLISKLDKPSAYPLIPASIAPGTPGDLLRRRPDIAAAEYRLQSATSKVGIATSGLYPRFTLSGLVGVHSFYANNLLSSAGETRNIFLGIDWSFLDRERVRARIDAANADAAGQLIEYQKTVQNALEETENSLIGYSKSQDERSYNQVAVSNASLSAEIARKQFKAGLIGYHEVLDIEQIELDTKDALIDSRHKHAIASIAIFKSVAGGWPDLGPL